MCAAALLHDAAGPGSGNYRLEHHHASAAFARQVLATEGWPEERIRAVEHCIRAHRFRHQSEPPQTLEAKIIFDADKLDSIGAVGAVRAISYSVHARQLMYGNLSEQFVKTGEKELGEPHTPYHEFGFKLTKLKDRMYTPTARGMAKDRHHFLEAFFARLQAELEGEC
ncbi:MAG: HD domain-containing protein [Chloroflexota bacterium]